MPLFFSRLDAEEAGVAFADQVQISFLLHLDRNGLPQRIGKTAIGICIARGIEGVLISDNLGR